MREGLCFCLLLSFFWEQMVKAYNYMSAISLVTHPSNRQASDRSRQPTKMDISLLQEKYDCLKQEQKLRTHVVVFKAGRNEAISKESMISAVLINKNMRKALRERETKQDWSCNGNLQESSPWRIYLGTHHLAQHQKHPCNPVQSQNEQSMRSCKESLERNNQVNQLPNQEGNPSSAEDTDGPTSSLTPAPSPAQTYTNLNDSASKPASSKVSYYPFPQRKTPKISEVARKLGLYVSQ